MVERMKKRWIPIILGMCLAEQASAQSLLPSISNQLPNGAAQQGQMGFSPQIQQLLQSQNLAAGQQNAVPTGIMQQKQLLQQINNPAQLSAVPPPPPATPLQPTTAATQVAPAAPAMSSEEMDEAMFEQSLSESLPLNQKQIREAKQRVLQTQRAAAGYYVVPPKPVSTTLPVDLSPGAQPPVIRLGQGYVSSLVFVDLSGAPWPIESYDLGNPGAFNIQWNLKSHTLMVQAMTSFTYGNLAVKLINLPTPVMLTLIPGQKVVDYRVDLRMQAMGPNAVPPPIESGLVNSEGTELIQMLEGIAPSGSRVLKVTGADAQAWWFNNNLYLRTRATLLSPAWLATVSSPDGTHAYQLQRTPNLLLSQNGKVVQLKVEGF